MWKGLSLLAVSDIGPRIRAKIAAISLYGAAGVVGLVAALFLLLALMIWIAQSLGPLAAALIVAGLLLLVAVGLVIAARASGTPKPQQRSTLSNAALFAAPTALTAVSKRVSFTTIAAVAAVALGALVGRKIARDM